MKDMPGGSHEGKNAEDVALNTGVSRECRTHGSQRH